MCCWTRLYLEDNVCLHFGGRAVSSVSVTRTAAQSWESCTCGLHQQVYSALRCPACLHGRGLLFLFTFCLVSSTLDKQQHFQWNSAVEFLFCTNFVFAQLMSEVKMSGGRSNGKRSIEEFASGGSQDSNIGDFMFRERKLFCKMGIDRKQVFEAIHKPFTDNDGSDSQSTDDEDDNSEDTQKSEKEDGDYEILTQVLPSQCGQPIASSSEMSVYEEDMVLFPVRHFANKAVQTSEITCRRKSV